MVTSLRTGTALSTKKQDSLDAWEKFRLAVAAHTGRAVDDPFVMSMAHALESITPGLLRCLEEYGWADGHLYIEKHKLVGASFGKKEKYDFS